MKFDKDGRELPDPTPVAPPLGFKREPGIVEMIRNAVRSEALRQAAERAGAETFEEADDFEVGDDYDPSSPYEQQFEPTPVAELRERAAKETRTPPVGGAAPSAEPAAEPQAAVDPAKAS